MRVGDNYSFLLPPPETSIFLQILPQAAIERGLELTCREMDNMGVEEHARKITGIMKESAASSIGIVPKRRKVHTKLAITMPLNS